MNNWQSVLQINILKKNLALNPNHLPLQEMYVTITIVKWLVSKWRKCLTEIPEENHLRLSDYLNQIWGPLSTLDGLQHFSFPWTPATKQFAYEMAGCLRHRLSPDAQNRAFAKNESCTQILDAALGMSKKTEFDWHWSFLKISLEFLKSFGWKLFSSIFWIFFPCSK